MHPLFSPIYVPEIMMGINHILHTVFILTIKLYSDNCFNI